MTWMLTASGRAVDLRWIGQDYIDIRDIAHALAQLNRFCGHACRPYSVAEHSVLVSMIAEQVFRLDAAGQLAALLHDAHEAYTGDLTGPMKQLIGPPFLEEERRIQAAVLRHFNVTTAYTAHHYMIKRADLMALATERRDLMPGHPEPWPELAGIDPVDWTNLNEVGADFTWQDWRQIFLDRFAELNHAVAERAHEISHPKEPQA